MTEADKGQFAALCTALAEAFGGQMSAIKLELYWRALDDLPYADISRAASAWMRSGKFFPRPADLREILEGRAEDRAASAYAALWTAARTIDGYASLVVEDGALAFALEATFRSWPAFCGLDLSPEMWAAKRKEFMAAYHAGLMRGGSPQVFIGLHEQANAARGLAAHVPHGGISADHRVLREVSAPERQTSLPASGWQALAAVSEVSA
jgi:hypothetical protein